MEGRSWKSWTKQPFFATLFWVKDRSKQLDVFLKNGRNLKIISPMERSRTNDRGFSRRGIATVGCGNVLKTGWIPFLRSSLNDAGNVRHQNRSRISIVCKGSFSADHDITFNLFVMRTKEIHHSIPTKKYKPPTSDNQLFESKNQAKKRNFQPFSYHFFSQPKTSSQPVPFPSRFPLGQFPHWIHHGVHGWHGGLARTPGGGSVRVP